MGKRKTKQPATLSEQLRDIIENGPVTRYRIAKESGVDASQLHRFVNKTGKLTTDSLDKIGAVLKLRFIQD
jgi:hypothetical protein